MKCIDYTRLRPGMIIGTTDTWHPMSITTRITCAGWRNLASNNIATHALAICEEHGLIYGMEMGPNGIRQIDLNGYENSVNGNHIVFVADPFDGIEEYYSRANVWLLDSHEHRIKYGIAGLLEFWGIGKGNPDKNHDGQPDKMICSELTYMMLKRLDIRYPKEWQIKVSPYDQQKYFTNMSKLVRWWK